jgi:metal-sulfur cluster biosynthetic enzyme
MTKQPTLTEKAVSQAISTVIDPELQIDIVSLGLIYNVKIEDNSKVNIRMTLTTPGCPLAPVIDQMVRESLFGLVADTDHDVTIDLTFDPPWIVDMMTEEARLELGL